MHEHIAWCFCFRATRNVFRMHEHTTCWWNAVFFGMHANAKCGWTVVSLCMKTLLLGEQYCFLYVWKRYCRVKSSACMHEAATCLVNYYVCLLYAWKLHCVVKRNVVFMHEHATCWVTHIVVLCMNTLPLCEEQRFFMHEYTTCFAKRCLCLKPLLGGDK